jgi:hypothetical protein
MFFITGLPRSRTKWFSQYFCRHEEVYCFHEVLAQCRARHEFYRAMELFSGINVGNSDCGLAFSDFQAQWPDAPTLIIERPLEDVAVSLGRIGLPNQETMLEHVQMLIGNLDGLRVQFDKIDESMPEIHDHLGIAYNQKMADAWKHMQISDSTAHASPDALRVWTGG